MSVLLFKDILPLHFKSDGFKSFPVGLQDFVRTLFAVECLILCFVITMMTSCLLPAQEILQMMYLAKQRTQ